ncbi:MAG: beta-N-acetylhexosaminidase [Deltaproteobacteria bacterium]|nr:beta-N-acetylhexosaminidase [Deltaproteobacteria bacterium]
MRCVPRFLPVVLVLALAAPGGTRAGDDAPPPPPRVVLGVELEPLLARMSVEQKVGQLLLLGFGGTELDDRARVLFHDKRPGGVALFSRNIGGRAQVRALTAAVRREMGAEIPPFIGVDQEGGNVIRLKERTTLLPSAMALGATRSPPLAEAAGRAVGADLRALGFNMNFAPVLDVNSNPANPVIGVRSFGERPELVAELGSAFIAGLRASGVAGVAKHFPGHGDTREDSHFRLPSVPHDVARLEAVELLPFERASREGLSAIMTAHLALPAITGDPDLPASLSREVLTGILRRKMGFQGIIMTDGLEMEAVAGRFGAGKAAVMAVKAGADMVMVLWFPEKKTEVHRALLAAARSGEIPRQRLDDAVLRVLGEKARLGLLGAVPPPPPAPGASTLGVDDQVAAGAVTLLRNEGDVLPLEAHQRVLVVSPDGTFAAALKQRLPRTRSILIPSTMSSEKRRAARFRALKQGREVDVAVVAVVNDVQLQVARALAQDRPGRPVVVVSLLSPYLLSQVPDVDAYLCTYSYLRPAQVAAARVISGHAQARGKLPVSIPRHAAFGDGLQPPRSASIGP